MPCCRLSLSRRKSFGTTSCATPASSTPSSPGLRISGSSRGTCATRQAASARPYRRRCHPSLPLTATNQAFINTIRAQVGQFWDLLQTNLIADEHPSLVKGLQSIKDGYFGKFQPLAAQMREASATGNYPMTLPQWVDVSTPLLATILDVMEGANHASEARTAAFQRGCDAQSRHQYRTAAAGRAAPDRRHGLRRAHDRAAHAIARPPVCSSLQAATSTSRCPVLAARTRSATSPTRWRPSRSSRRKRLGLKQKRSSASHATGSCSEFDAAVGGIVKAALVGDFSQRVPLDDKQGVILNLASALNTMCDNFDAVVNDMDRMFGSLAEGDLTCRIESRISRHVRGAEGQCQCRCGTSGGHARQHAGWR